MDALHYALLAVVVLLAVYCGASFFREGCTGYKCKVTKGQEKKVQSALANLSSAAQHIYNPLSTDHIMQL